MLDRRLALLLLTAALAAAQEKANPFASDPSAAGAARGPFRIYCAACHGIRAQGGRGPDLTRGVFNAGERDADLFRVISNGVAGSEMSGYSFMGDESVWRLVSYVRSVAQAEKSPPRGDRVAGSALYHAKGGCAQCHAIGGKGGRAGPDLTRVGRQRSAAYLRESVVSPDADVMHGYRTVTVVTRDGKKIVGVERGFDNFSAQLMDLDENFHSFRKTGVRSMVREERSLMPAGYEKMFPGKELDDLLAYLASLGREAKP